MSLIAKAIAIGFSVASPGDTIGFLCIHQTLKNGIRHGIAASFGAAGADTLYGLLVIFGFKASQLWLLGYKTQLTVAEGLFLCGLGIKEFFSKSSDDGAQHLHRGLLTAFVTTFFLTLASPSTILEFTALFTEFDITPSGFTESVIFNVGIFIGAALWWLLLCVAAEFFRKRMSEHILQYVNHIAGIIIFGFGLYAFSKLWR